MGEDCSVRRSGLSVDDSSLPLIGKLKDSMVEFLGIVEYLVKTEGATIYGSDVNRLQKKKKKGLNYFKTPL